MIGSNHAL
jgi:hypothetical protein